MEEHTTCREMLYVNRKAFSHELSSRIRSQLTIRKQDFITQEATSYVGWDLKYDGYIGLPIAWAIKNAFWLKEVIGLDDLEDLQTYSPGSVDFGEPVFKKGKTYWPGQRDAIDCTFKGLLEKNTGILEAKAGSGKTLMGLSVAAKLKQKTLVIVHKEDLAGQWKSTGRAFFPKASFGHVQASERNWENKDVVTATAQTIWRRAQKPAPWFFDFVESFGFIIFDEVHRYSAKSFSTCLSLFPARHKLGVTATLRRSDGMLPVLFWHLGETLHKAKTEHEVGEFETPKLKCLGPMTSRAWYFRRRIFLPKVINSVVANEVFNEWIIDKTLSSKKEGRTPLIVSDRVKHLDSLSKKLEASGIRVGRYYGAGKKDKEADKEVILATYAKMSEGTDIPKLDTLIVASPKGDIEQTVGRIQRRHPGKQKPLILDACLVGTKDSYLKRLQDKRVFTYLKLGFTKKEN